VAVVVDRAEELCPVLPADPETALCTHSMLRIGADGARLGVTLMLVTERPRQVYEHVLARCENVVLTHTGADAELDHIAGMFSFATAPFVARAPGLEPDEALVAGAAAPQPARLGLTRG
jgi:hypothetical protein